MPDETLYDRALAQEGEPIPNDKVVLIELLDGHGTVNESWTLTRNERSAEVAKWASDFVVSMAAEGMAGSVRWSSAQEPEDAIETKAAIDPHGEEAAAREPGQGYG